MKHDHVSPSFAQGYDPDYLRQNLESVSEVLVEHLRKSLEGKGKVLIQNSIQEIAQQLDFDAVVASGGADLTALTKVLLGNSNRLHHPNYIGHQVAVPMVGAAIADLINGATNNSMPVYEMGPAATAVEHKMVEWALSKVGWQGEGAGVMTHGGSMSNLTCLLAARANRAPGSWENGLPQGCVIMVPESSHYSNARAAAIMGLGTKAVIRVPVDEKFQIKVDEFKKCYHQLVSSGKTVLAAVANACCTATGIYDNLAELGAFCQENGIWFHVDGAHGASALITDRYRHLLRGVELADSLTWDTHKMLATSSLCGMALFRKRTSMLKTFSQDATYIFNSFEKPGEDISVNTLECTKAMLGLKLFFNLAIVGEKGLGQHVETLYDNTRRFYELITNRPGWNCLCAPDANILCFRYGDDSALQDAIRQRIVGEGDFYITRATVHGKSYLRLSVMNSLTSEKEIIRLCVRVEQLERELAHPVTAERSAHAEG